MSILFHQSFLKDKSREKEVRRWRNIITNQNKKAMIPFCKAILDRENVLEKLSSVSISTAIIVGENDEPTPPENNKRIADTIPNSYYFTIPNAGHSAAVEKPEEVADSMRKFYNEIGLI
jgi:pimeloyl-ACP methyl ester carboxylesterase